MKYNFRKLELNIHIYSLFFNSTLFLEIKNFIFAFFIELLDSRFMKLIYLNILKVKLLIFIKYSNNYVNSKIKQKVDL